MAHKITWSRKAGEMSAVAHKPPKDQNAVVYDVCRGAEMEKDRKYARRLNLRYDLTYLYPNRLGKELSKTYGHYHNKDYPEIMEVLEGKGWFLFQLPAKNKKIVRKAYLIEAEKGEKIITPPYFGHISVNPMKNKTLILANWLSVKEKSDYKPYEKLGGACYYIIRGKKGFIFKKNKNYSKTPQLIHLRPKETPQFGGANGRRSKSLYSLIKNPEKLEFLNNPKKYKKLLTIENCYKKK